MKEPWLAVSLSGVWSEQLQCVILSPVATCSSVCFPNTFPGWGP